MLSKSKKKDSIFLGAELLDKTQFQNGSSRDLKSQSFQNDIEDQPIIRLQTTQIDKNLIDDLNYDDSIKTIAKKKNIRESIGPFQNNLIKSQRFNIQSTVSPDKKLVFADDSQKFQMFQDQNTNSKHNGQTKLSDNVQSSQNYQIAGQYASPEKYDSPATNFTNVKNQLSSKKKNNFLEKIRKNVQESTQLVTYDLETKTTQFIQPNIINQIPYKNFTLEKPEKCSICNHHSKEIKFKEQYGYGLKVVEDEHIFSHFVNNEIQENGKQKVYNQVQLPKKVKKQKVYENAHEKLQWDDVLQKKLNQNVYNDSESEESIHIDYLKDLKEKNKNFQQKIDDYIFVQKDYNWLMRNLVQSKDKLNSCNINIPEMVLFNEGIPKYFLKNDKDGFITQVNKNKLKIQDVEIFFTNLTAERKKILAAEKNAAENNQKKENQSDNLSPKNTNGQNDNNPYNDINSLQDNSITDNLESPKHLKLCKNNFQSNLSSSSPGFGNQSKSYKKFAKLPQYDKDRQSQNDKDKLHPNFSVLQDWYYKEQFLIRFIKNENYNNVATQKFTSDSYIFGQQVHSKILTEKDLKEKVHKENKTYWLDVCCIQIMPFYKIGFGKTFKFVFSPINFEKILENEIQNVIQNQFSKKQKQSVEDENQQENDFKESLIKKFQGEYHYDYQQYGNDDFQLQQKNPDAFCLKQCNKLGAYLQKYHNIEIIRMQAEFIQDESGFIMLYHAQNIWIRVKESHSMFGKQAQNQEVQPQKAQQKYLGEFLKNDKFWENTQSDNYRLKKKSQLMQVFINELAEYTKLQKSLTENKEDIIKFLERVQKNNFAPPKEDDSKKPSFHKPLEQKFDLKTIQQIYQDQQKDVNSQEKQKKQINNTLQSAKNLNANSKEKIKNSILIEQNILNSIKNNQSLFQKIGILGELEKTNQQYLSKQIIIENEKQSQEKKKYRDKSNLLQWLRKPQIQQNSQKSCMTSKNLLTDSNIITNGENSLNTNPQNNMSCKNLEKQIGSSNPSLHSEKYLNIQLQNHSVDHPNFSLKNIDSRPNKEAPLSNKNIAVRNILATQKNSFDLNNEYMSIHETLNNSFKNEDFSKNQNLNSQIIPKNVLSTERKNEQQKQVLQTIESQNKALPKNEFQSLMEQVKYQQELNQFIPDYHKIDNSQDSINLKMNQYNSYQFLQKRRNLVPPILKYPSYRPLQIQEQVIQRIVNGAKSSNQKEKLQLQKRISNLISIEQLQKLNNNKLSSRNLNLNTQIDKQEIEAYGNVNKRQDGLANFIKEKSPVIQQNLLNYIKSQNAINVDESLFEQKLDNQLFQKTFYPQKNFALQQFKHKSEMQSYNQNPKQLFPQMLNNNQSLIQLKNQNSRSKNNFNQFKTQNGHNKNIFNQSVYKKNLQKQLQQKKNLKDFKNIDLKEKFDEFQDDYSAEEAMYIQQMEREQKEQNQSFMQQQLAKNKIDPQFQVFGSHNQNPYKQVKNFAQSNLRMASDQNLLSQKRLEEQRYNDITFSNDIIADQKKPKLSPITLKAKDVFVSKSISRNTSALLMRYNE